MHKTLFILVAYSLLLTSSCGLDTNAAPFAATQENPCPPEGSTVNTKIIALNKLKNRSEFPGVSEFDTSVTLLKMLKPGEDSKRWNAHKAAAITGYVYDVKPGGVETCNCKTKIIDERDTHIELTIDPMQTGKTQRVVVEVTPRIRKIMLDKGQDWSTKSLRKKLLGRWVKFEGWLLFDEEHANQAENTNPGRARNWRATAWEIHPVTKIEVVAKPR